MMRLSFKEYLLQVESIGGGSFLPSTFTGSEAPDLSIPHLPDIDLALPSVTQIGTVTSIAMDKNPIVMVLDNGTTLMFSHDEFRRMKKDKDIVPKHTRVQVVFQRHGDDKSAYPSQIQSCHIL